MTVRLTHLGQYWSSERREVRLLGAENVRIDDRIQRGDAFDITDSVALARARRRYRSMARGESWAAHRWTYGSLPFPSTEFAEWSELAGVSIPNWAAQGIEVTGLARFDLASLSMSPDPATDHWLPPIVPRRALAFGVTYLNSALERETEGRRRDYGYVYRAVKDRGERPELFIKGSSPEHFVGPGGRMALRRDLTNSVTIDGEPCARELVRCGIESELAAVVTSKGEIWGYTLANDVSGNRIENETLLYLMQAKYFTGALVLGPLIRFDRRQDNPGLEIRTRIFSASGDTIFERRSSTSRINAPIRSLIEQAGTHIRLTPGEVFSTGTDVVPDGIVKVLEPGMRVELSSPEIGVLEHGCAEIDDDGSLNLDYSRLEFES
jgi:2-keto-4-pentenoate hydratase/2-oxohepta-3-ene-1,7-dioic acid hydratase in catechol pathway